MMGLEWVLEAPNTLNKNNIGKEAVKNEADTKEHTRCELRTPHNNGANYTYHDICPAFQI